MKYFEQLPTVNIYDKTFRNLFRRVIVNYQREDQLINYKMKEYENLAGIAHSMYGTAQFWWVIALLNNIHDINFDIPLSSLQIESLAQELSTYKSFKNSILKTGLATISTGETRVSVSFTNTYDDDFSVFVSAKGAGSLLSDLGEIGHQVTARNSFDIVMENTRLSDTEFTYVVFNQPDSQEVMNTSEFTEFFDKLVKEADLKRTIRLIKPEHLGDFLTEFMLALRDGTEMSDGIVYKNEINELVEYPEREYPDHGLVVQFDSDQFSGDGLYTELDIDEYDFDYHIYLSPKPTDLQIGTIGNYGVRKNFTKPRVYNDGSSGIGFDYIVVSPDDKEFSASGELLESGIGEFEPGGYEEITISNYPEFETSDDVGLLVTAIIDEIGKISNIGKWCFEVMDKNTIRAHNNGLYSLTPIRFFWSVYKVENE